MGTITQQILRALERVLQGTKYSTNCLLGALLADAAEPILASWRRPRQEARNYWEMMSWRLGISCNFELLKLQEGEEKRPAAFVAQNGILCFEIGLK